MISANSIRSATIRTVAVQAQDLRELHPQRNNTNRCGTSSGSPRTPSAAQQYEPLWYKLRISANSIRSATIRTVAVRAQDLGELHPQRNNTNRCGTSSGSPRTPSAAQQYEPLRYELRISANSIRSATIRTVAVQAQDLGELHPQRNNTNR